VETDKDHALERISDIDDLLYWNEDYDNADESEDNCTADSKSDIEQDTGIKNPECPEWRDESPPPNVPRLIWLTTTSQRQAEMVLMMVNAIETRRN